MVTLIYWIAGVFLVCVSAVVLLGTLCIIGSKINDIMQDTK